MDALCRLHTIHEHVEIDHRKDYLRYTMKMGEWQWNRINMASTQSSQIVIHVTISRGCLSKCASNIIRLWSIRLREENIVCIDNDMVSFFNAYVRCNMEQRAYRLHMGND